MRSYQARQWLQQVQCEQEMRQLLWGARGQIPYVPLTPTMQGNPEDIGYSRQHVAGLRQAGLITHVEGEVGGGGTKKGGSWEAWQQQETDGEKNYTKIQC